jgi:hypothetical protein
LEAADSSDSQHWAQQQQQQQQRRRMVLSGPNEAGNSSSSEGSGSSVSSEEDAAAAVPPVEQQQGRRVEPKLFVLGNGSGSPCLDLSRVPAALADATVGVDLLVSSDHFYVYGYELGRGGLLCGVGGHPAWL